VRAARPWLTWLLILAVVTAAMVGVRDHLKAAHVALVYLLVVQMGSARAGRTIGLVLAGLSFAGFNWFFLPPFGTFVLADPLDWLVLGAFLATSVVSAQLLYLAAEAKEARSLKEAQRAKDAVLASVSHDLRTPLTTIKGLAHEIATGGDERAAIIEEEADRLTTFVAQLLDLSRVTSGSAALDVGPNEAEDLLGAAAQQVQGRLQGRSLEIHVANPDAMLFGRFDFAQTLRALVNLIDNAAKYSPPAEPIEVTAERRDSRLCFHVADRGRGVPDAERERIFEAFYRRPGVGPDVGGAGLGLSIARGIADAQGGSLTYRPREGGGSVFTLEVPALDVAAGGGA
jgi:two-component system sensor histidine kinase KdpD